MEITLCINDRIHPPSFVLKMNIQWFMYFKHTILSHRNALVLGVVSY